MTPSDPAAGPGPGRIDVCATRVLPAPATEVWGLIGDFGGVGAWLPGIEAVTLEGDGVGATRICRTVLGVFRERLIAVDGQSCRYAIDAGPVPVRNYEAVLAVEPCGAGQHCRVVWTSSFEAAAGTVDGEARRRIAQIYAAGLDALSARFGAVVGDDAALDNAGRQINGCLLVNVAQPVGEVAMAADVKPVVTRKDHLDTQTAQSGGAVRVSGVSRQHTPATKLWYGKVSNEPGFRSLPHHHGEAETGGYVLHGRGRIYFGESYGEWIDMEEGDFVFVPPFMPHVEVNLSADDDLVWLTTRTPENIVVNLPDVPDESLAGFAEIAAAAAARAKG